MTTPYWIGSNLETYVSLGMIRSTCREGTNERDAFLGGARERSARRWCSCVRPSRLPAKRDIAPSGRSLESVLLTSSLSLPLESARARAAPPPEQDQSVIHRFPTRPT